jgi:hypothetical protein
MELRHFRFGLFQPKPHVQLMVYPRRGIEMLAGARGSARAPVELAEAEVAVRNERAHTTRLGERERLVIVRLAAFCVEPVWVGRDVTEQVQRMSPPSGLVRPGFQQGFPQAPRIVELTKRERCSA